MSTEALGSVARRPPPWLKTALKALRASQPFNGLATSGLKAALGVLGVESDRLIRYLPRVGTVRARLPNGRVLRLASRGDDAVTDRIYWKGWAGFEPGVSDVFYRLAERSAVVLDVGAHVGFYSILAALANPDGRVHAFEPLATVYERLVANVALNGLEGVTCSRVAAGASAGEAEFFHVDMGYLPSASSLSHAFLASHTHLATARVPVVPLDSYVETHAIGRVDLVKVDTETTEPDVLRGLLGTLKRDRPALVCEVLGWYDTGQAAALDDLLRPLGYRFYLLSPRGPIPVEAITCHETWWNYLFTTDDPGTVAAVTGYPVR